MSKQCSVEGCERPTRTRGMCSMHYKRVLATGTPADRKMPSTEARFWAKVNKTETCWLWTGARNGDYGDFYVDRQCKSIGAHRYSYLLSGREIPDGYHVDHLCRTPLCVNPAHLETVTGGENTRRAIRIGHPHPNAPTSCRQGHDWTVRPPYEWLRPNGYVMRRCRECHTERMRNIRRAGRAA